MKTYDSISFSFVLATFAASQCLAFSTPKVSRQVFLSRTFPLPLTSTSTTTTQIFAEGTKITMPALSSTMKEGRVVTWLKNEGDEIEAGEAIMVVESDKADMDVEAFEDGVLAKILVGEGEMAPVGETVAIIAESAADVASVIASYESRGSATAPAAATPTASVDVVAAVEASSSSGEIIYVVESS
jgi:pyruvate dehydrogenase E2 component (dihydrolipoamide acetyltransferase)